MKKSTIIVATALTFMLTAGMIKVASLALNYRYNYDDEGDVPYQFYKDSMEYDVLFLGTSHVGCAVYPMQLWHDRGISSYSLATGAASIPSSYHIFKNAIRYHKPKIAMLDTYLVGIAEKVYVRLDTLHYSFDIIPPSWEKYKSLKDLFPNFESRMAYIFSYSLFHNRWKEMTVEKIWDALFHTPISTTKGGPWRDYMGTVASPALVPKTEALLPNNTIGMDYIRAFVSLCRENKIIPILITIPFPASEGCQMEENSVALLAKEQKVSYFNLNKMNVIDWNTDLHDSYSHLNMSGGRKVTDYIGRLLVENYGLTDHRSESAYASWYVDYELYKQKLFDIMCSQTDIKSVLMLCNNSVYTARISVKDGIELDYVIQKLIAQLGDVLVISSEPETPTHDIHLEVYDSETGSLICAKNWGFLSQLEFVYRN
ncbi:MAG: hypothetical protein K6G18_06540 [Treponema sp.]|nr:hypothetical protein [Treponema sp.]